MSSHTTAVDVVGNVQFFAGGRAAATGAAASRLEPNQRSEWRGFAISAGSMLLLSVFTVWRASVTAWRQSNKFYFFPNQTWLGWVDRQWLRSCLGRIDHSWVNDFLLGPGTVACFYVVFTALYAAGGLFYEDGGSIFNSNRTSNNDSSWADHKRLMQTILYGLLVRALIESWGEEVGIFTSPFIFDRWDLSVELAGVIVGAWMVHILSYPLFSKAPHFAPELQCAPNPNYLRVRFSIDVLSVIVTAVYLFIIDPFASNSLTVFERWTLPLEVAVIFIAFRFAFIRGMYSSSTPIRLDLLR